MKGLRILILFLIFFCLPYAAQAAEEKKQVTIGLITDLSNDGATVGLQSQAGARLAIKFLESQGKKIRIIVGDHKLDTKLAVSEVQKMLLAEKVDAVISDSTPTSFAISPIVAAAKKIMIYVSPVSSLKEKNPYAFRSFIDYKVGCKKLAEIFHGQKIEKLGMLKINFEFADVCFEGVREVYQNPYVITYNKGEEMRTLSLKLKQHNVGAIIQMGYEADFLNGVKGRKELNLTAPIGLPTFWLTDKVKEEAKDTGVIYYGFGFKDVEESFTQKLRDAKLFISDVNIETAAMSYQNVLHLYEALSGCEREDVDCQVSKLSEQKAVGVIGFEGWKNREAQFLMSYKKWGSGVFTALD